MNRAIVDGIERAGTASIGLRCDFCPASYTGGNGTNRPGPYRPNGYRAYESAQLQVDARSIGWTGPLTRSSKEDRCPECVKKGGA